MARTRRTCRAIGSALPILAGGILRRDIGVLRCHWTGYGDGIFEMAYQEFKLPFHQLKRADLLVHLAEPFAAECNDLLHLGRLAPPWSRHALERAVKIKKLPDFGQGEADFVVAADEKHPVQVPRAVVPISGGCPRWRWQQPLPFIKPNGLDIHSCRTSYLSNLHYEIIHPILGYKASVWTTIKAVSQNSPECRERRHHVWDSSRCIDSPDRDAARLVLTSRPGIMDHNSHDEPGSRPM